MVKKINVILLFLLIMICEGCGISSQLANKDFALLYSPKANKLDVWFKIYHHSNNRSTLYLNYSATNLLYAKPVNEESMQSKIKLHYKLFSGGDNAVFLDSASFTFIHNKEDGIQRFTDSLTFACGKGNNYILEIKVEDLNKKYEVEETLFVDKSHANSEQNYILKREDKVIFHQHSLDVGENIQIELNDSNVKALYVYGFFSDFPMALPPYSIENYLPEFKPDTQITIVKKEVSFNFSVKHLGYYLISTDTNSNKGAFIRAFGVDYPDLSTYAEMILPLRYLCTRNEYETLLHNPEPKKAIDKFWLDLSSNKERARELIKQYYNRVQLSNLYFASYKAGWKTDRGMIYIVFGAPNFVNRSTTTEIWTYGEQHNYRSLVFYFNRNEKSINPNDFVLDRNPLFKDEWMQAVDVWRQGRVYNPYN